MFQRSSLAPSQRAAPLRPRASRLKRSITPSSAMPCKTSGDAIYGARHVALKAGVPFDRPALTVNRLCGSGIQSIVSGAQMIQLEEAQACLVGGMESMSQAPHVIRGARSGFALGQGKLEDSLMVALLDTYCNTPMAGTAEN